MIIAALAQENTRRTRQALDSALTWPIDVILDLHRHLQRHRLWHKTPQLIATRLIAYGDLDYRVVFILGEGQRQGDGQLPFVYNPSCYLLKSMGFFLTVMVKSPISPQEESAHGRQNCRDVLSV